MRFLNILFVTLLLLNFSSLVCSEADTGNLPKITTDPDRPIPSEEMTLIFRDSETGEPLEDLELEIYYIRDGKEKSKKRYTGPNGTILFLPSKAGEYKLIVHTPEYSGVTSFFAKHNFIIDGPYPANPVVGELITLAVPPGIGVKVIDEIRGDCITCTTTMGGGVNFTLDKPGDYTIMIGEMNLYYWWINRSITISDRLTPTIGIPENPVVNKEMVITIKVDGIALEGAKVNIGKPIGASEEYTTDSEGKITFLPASTGQFRVNVEKERYSSISENFYVKNSFQISLIPEKPTTNSEVSVVVKNQMEMLVSDASVSIEDASISGLTNMDGRFKFKLPDSGNYKLVVRKDGYWDSDKTIEIFNPIFLELSSTEVELGDTISIKVMDDQKNEVSANIVAIKPDGVQELIEGTFTPTDVGNYEISADVAGLSIDKALRVNPHPLSVSTDISGERLIIKLSSHEEPVSGISVLIERDTKNEELITDEEGVASTEIEEGEIKIVIDNQNYENKKIIRKVVKRHNYLLLLAGISIVIVVFLAYSLMKKEGANKKEKLPLRRKNSSLSKI